MVLRQGWLWQWFWCWGLCVFVTVDRGIERVSGSTLLVERAVVGGRHADHQGMAARCPGQRGGQGGGVVRRGG